MKQNDIHERIELFKELKLPYVLRHFKKNFWKPIKGIKPMMAFYVIFRKGI